MVVPTVLIMVLAGLGLAPAASAITCDVDRSWILELEIHKNETVDVTQVIKSENGDLIRDCDVSSFEENFGIDGDVKTGAKSGNSGKSCTFTADDMTLEQFNNNSFRSRISHEDDSFTFEMGHLDDSEKVTIKVTFPGSAFEVSGRGEKSSSTAIWKIAQTENYNLIAKGADHASSRDSEDTDTNSSPLIIIIIVLMLTTIGGVAAFIIIRQKRTKAGAPGYPQPGQQPYDPQPGYGQPAQAPPPAPPSRVPRSARRTAALQPPTEPLRPAGRQPALRPRLVSPDRLTPLHPRLDASARAASAYRTFSPGVEAVDPWSAAPDQYSPGIFLRPRSPVG